MRTLASFLSVAFLGACSFQLGTSEPGQQHNADFSYAACFFGCTTNQKMMVGTQEGIGVHAGTIPPVAITSSAPSVLTVTSASRTCCSSGSSGTCRNVTLVDACASNETPELIFQVHALSEGSADIALTQTNGKVFDVVTLTAVRPASLQLTCNGHAIPVVLDASQSSCGMGWNATDANGDDLRATTGVALTTSDAKVAAFQQLLGSPEESVQGVQGFLGTSLVRVGPGDATIGGSAGDVSAQLAVHAN